MHHFTRPRGRDKPTGFPSSPPHDAGWLRRSSIFHHPSPPTHIANQTKNGGQKMEKKSLTCPRPDSLFMIILFLLRFPQNGWCLVMMTNQAKYSFSSFGCY